MSSKKVSFTPTHSREDLYSDVVVLKQTATGLKTVYQASKAIDKWCGLEQASKARTHDSTKSRYTSYQTQVTQNQGRAPRRGGYCIYDTYDPLLYLRHLRPFTGTGFPYCIYNSILLYLRRHLRRLNQTKKKITQITQV